MLLALIVPLTSEPPEGGGSNPPAHPWLPGMIAGGGPNLPTFPIVLPPPPDGGTPPEGGTPPPSTKPPGAPPPQAGNLPAVPPGYALVWIPGKGWKWLKPGDIAGAIEKPQPK